jgi:hypothetical protein
MVGYCMCCYVYSVLYVLLCIQCTVCVVMYTIDICFPQYIFRIIRATPPVTPDNREYNVNALLEDAVQNAECVSFLPLTTNLIFYWSLKSRSALHLFSLHYSRSLRHAHSVSLNVPVSTADVGARLSRTKAASVGNLCSFSPYSSTCLMP